MTLGDKDNIVVIGAGGHGKVVIDAILCSGKKVIAVFDDTPHLKGTEILGQEVVGPLSDLSKVTCFHGIIAIGDGRARKKLKEVFPRARWETIIHPSATISRRAKIGQGCVVLENSLVQAAVQIGHHVIVNAGVVVCHDCKIGDYSHLAPKVVLAGHVSVGEDSFVGAGTVTLPRISLGKGSVVGASSLVVSNIPDATVAYGSPARIVRHQLFKAELF